MANQFTFLNSGNKQSGQLFQGFALDKYVNSLHNKRKSHEKRVARQIIKRNGQVAEFDPDKIYQAILKAAQTVYVLDDTWRQNLAQVTKKVVLDLQDAQVERPTINMIQSLVENRLMEAGFINIAEHYISYRLQRDFERNGYGDKDIVHLRFEQTK